MREIWEAADRVAEVLCRSPIVPSHAHVMGTWRHADPADHVRRVLHDDPTSSTWESNPLLMGLVLVERPVVDSLAETDEGRDWIKAALEVALGFGRIVEFLRSRLARYPRLSVPHVLPSSVRTQQAGFYFGPGFPWFYAFRKEAPQLLAGVDLAPLQFDRAASADAQAAITGLLTALRSSPQWQDHEATADALSEADEEELRRIIRLFRDQTREEVVDAVEESNLMRRHRYTESVLETAVEQATGLAADYVAAFERVDELISAVARVISELVVFGPPPLAGAAVDGSWRAGRFGYHVRLTTDSDMDFVMRPGMVEVSSEVGALAGVVLTEAQQVSLQSMLSGFAAALSGELLPLSSGTLRAGPAWS